MADWTMKISRPLNRVWKRDDYLEGHVVTSVGIVYAYSERAAKATNLQVAWSGKLYSQSYPRAYTDRGLVTLASRFAQEVADGSHD